MPRSVVLIGWGRLSATVAVAVLSVACASGDAPTREIVLPLRGASEVPLSGNRSLVLIDEATACTMASYEEQVHCVGPNGEGVVRFGGQGQGPGEFDSGSTRILRGPSGMIGVVDPSLNRMSVFAQDGTLKTISPIPESGIGVDYLASPSFATTVTLAKRHLTREMLRDLVGAKYRHVEIDMASGETVWERMFPFHRVEPPLPCERGEGFLDGLGTGTFSPSGVVAFMPCRGEIVFFADRDALSGTAISAPGYVLEYPSNREVQEYVEEAGAFADEDTWRRTPKPYALGYEGARVFDGENRFWVATVQKRGEGFSYLDVYKFHGPGEVEYLGDIRVRHTVIAIDVLGSTLAVLVDRPDRLSEKFGIVYPGRGIDWYDIGNLAESVSDPSDAPQSAS